MSLLDEIERSTRRSGPQCAIGALLATLPEVEAADIRASLAADYQSTAIARALSNRYKRVGADAVQRHRRGDCACP